MSDFSPVLSFERQRQARFLAVTILAYLVYVLVYRVFVGIESFVHHQILIYVLAIVVGDSVNYVGNRYWVFRADQERIRTQGGRFFLVMLCSLILQTILFRVGRSSFLLPETLLLLLLPGFRAAMNYVCHRAFTFDRSSSPRA